MDAQSMELLDYILNTALTFLALYFDVILATFIFFLGYSLFRVGLERLPTPGSREPVHYLRSVGPGAAFVLLGTVILVGRDPLLLALFLVVLTVSAGFGFIGIGYRLIVQGLYQAADAEEAWKDSRTLLGRGAPGALLTLIGIAMISNALWSAPEDFREYSSDRVESNEQLEELVEARVGEGLALFREYLGTQTTDSAEAAPESTIE